MEASGIAQVNTPVEFRADKAPQLMQIRKSVDP